MINLKKLDEVDKICAAAGNEALEIFNNADCGDYGNCDYHMERHEVEDFEAHEHINYCGIRTPVINMDDCYVLAEPVAVRIKEAYNTLPALIALVREIYGVIKNFVDDCGDCNGTGVIMEPVVEFNRDNEPEMVADRSPCWCWEARDIKERMEAKHE